MRDLPARALDALGPAITARAGPLLAPLLAALADPLAETDEQLVVPARPLGAAPLFDATTTAHPRWLAQAAGLRIPAALSVAAARAYLIGRGVARRGTPLALRAAARSALTGTGIVRLTERVGGDAYAATLITYASQTPNPGAVLAAAAAEKPVGLVLTHTVLPGQTWGDIAAGGYTLGELKMLTVRQIREAAPRG